MPKAKLKAVAKTKTKTSARARARAKPDPKARSNSKTKAKDKAKNAAAEVSKTLFFFWKETECEGGFLSPWFRSPFEDYGNIYESVGHMIMAEKARLFDDKVLTFPTAMNWKVTTGVLQEVLKRILATKAADEHKTLGSSIKEVDQRVWQESMLFNVHCLRDCTTAVFSIFLGP